MKLKFLLVLIPAFFQCVPASAEEVNEANVTTFVDGTPAVAAEVNANFQALIDAINDNASRISSLESSGPSGSSVAGSTFLLNQIGVLNRTNGTTFSTTANMTQQYTVTFNSDMTWSLSGTESEGELLINSSNNLDGNVDSLDYNLTAQSDGDPVSFTGTYTQTGSTITTSIDLTFTVTFDGNVLMATDFYFGPEEDDASVTRSESSFVVGIRTQ